MMIEQCFILLNILCASSESARREVDISILKGDLRPLNNESRYHQSTPLMCNPLNHASPFSRTTPYMQKVLAAYSQTCHMSVPRIAPKCTSREGACLAEVSHKGKYLEGNQNVC